MRTNHSGVTEVASIRMDQDKYSENHKQIFGEPEKKFCDNCDQRFAYCKCEIKALKKLDELSEEIINEHIAKEDSFTNEEKEVLESFIDTLKIKDMARKSYQDIPMDNGSEGFPESSSYIYGFMEGYQKAIEDLK